MSTTKTILRSGTIIAAGFASLAMTACASNSSADRYGNVYDYESGSKCAATASCGAPAPTSTRYGDAYTQPAAPVYQAPRTENVVYADCSVINGMNCGPTYQPQPTQVYTAPAPTYTAPVQTYTQPTQSYNTGISYGGESAPCPAGTTAAGDGTCMQSSYTAPTTSYNSTSSYTAPTTSYGSTSSYSGETAACPAGTTAAGDGTCMQGSSYSSNSYSSSTPSYSSDSSYSSSSYSSGSSYSGDAAACPAGSTSQGDGTCAMNEGMSANVEIFNDASSSYGGYTSTGGYTANDYMPVRK